MQFKRYKWGSISIGLIAIALFAGAIPVFAQEKAAEQPGGGPHPVEVQPEQAEGAGQLIRKEEGGVHICPGCLSTIFTEGSKGSIIPYGRVELDAIYSSRNNNPLDPGQFNGYATAAGRSGNATSTLNPRYSVFGVRAERTDGKHSLTGVVEVDFYGQTDNANNLPPRLRLAYVRYEVAKTNITIGMDWTPIMALHPDLIDFSIMGYGGNLWNRLPQITVRHKFTDNIEGLFTVMRFERGLSAGCCGNVQARPGPNTPPSGSAPGGGGSNIDPFNDPAQHPYYGARLAYNGTGSLQGMMVSLSTAYRYYRSAPIRCNIAGTCANAPAGFGGQDINSYLVGAEVVMPISKRLKFSGEIAYGQALGNEFFRWNQELNLTTGKPIRTWVGWAQLSYAPTKSYTFLAGYGFDSPLKSDVRGSTTAIDTQYQQNQRMYVTAIRPIWADFYIGAEFQNLWTAWADNESRFSGQQYNLSVWYNF